MANLFKSLTEKFFSKKVSLDPNDFTGKFRVGRGSGGFAFHVIEGNEWDSLCGISVVERKSEITPDQLAENLPSQHRGFNYCSKCTTEFTGISAEEQREIRSLGKE